MQNTYTIELPKSMDGAGGDMGTGGMSLDIKHLIQTVYRRFWLIVIGFVATFATIAYMTFSMTPIYNAEAVVIVDTTEKNVIDLGSVFGGIAGSTAVIDTEVKVMGSKSLLSKVAVKEGLIEDPEFNWTLAESKPSLLGSIKSGIGSLFGGSDEVVDPFAGMTEDEKNERLQESVVGALMARTSVNRVGTTYLITVRVTSVSPEKAARLANAIADQYSVVQLDSKVEAVQRASEWLAERVEGMRQEVELKERRVEEYRASTGLLSASGSTLTETEISSLSQQLYAAEANLTTARARYNNIKRTVDSGAGVDALAEVLGSGVISGLKSQRAQILRRVAELETRYASQHPELITVRNEAEDIERQIRAEVNRIVSNLETEVGVAQEQVRNFQGRIASARATLGQNNRSMVELRELERDAETSRVIYEEFISRSKETREQDALVQADSRTLSAASVPGSPSSPKTLLNLFVGAVLGGIVGGGLALLAEIFNNTFSSSEEVTRRLGVPSLGAIPLIPNNGLLQMSAPNPADFLVNNPLSAYAEGIRYLRAAIAFSDLDTETKTVAVTSSLPDEGKTSLTLSLGRMSAMSGAKTLVIDGDFRRRQLTDAAGLHPDVGFIEYLFGAGTLDQAIAQDEKSGLHILPLTRSGHTPNDVFGTKAFDKLLAELREQYDLILIDTGPLLLMAEARVIAGKADKSILVVRWRHSSSSVVKQSINLLRSFDAKLLGVTLNMVDLNRRRHHGEPGYTHKAHRKYYTTGSGGKRKLFGSIRGVPFHNPVTSDPIDGFSGASGANDLNPDIDEQHRSESV